MELTTSIPPLKVEEEVGEEEEIVGGEEEFKEGGGKEGVDKEGVKEEVKKTNDGMYNLITFGKFENRYLKDMLRDRKYCSWLKDQEWFKTSYEYLYNSINKYDPKEFFFSKTLEEETKSGVFMNDYKYFNLLPPTELIGITLDEKEMKCYKFYLEMINNLKKRVDVRKVSGEDNPYDIKAPVKWLQLFEKENKIPREEFKEFLYAYELPNVTTIVGDIRKEGGLEYNGGNSYKIGKKRSLDQENFWGVRLKNKFGEQVSGQYLYLNCIFDFIHIPANTIYECKLGLKDFNEEQFDKYETIMNRFNIVYLIGYDCVINMDLETIYTTDMMKYVLYQCNIPVLKLKSKLDEIILNYDICEVEDLSEVL